MQKGNKLGRFEQRTEKLIHQTGMLLVHLQPGLAMLQGRLSEMGKRSAILILRRKLIELKGRSLPF